MLPVVDQVPLTGWYNSALAVPPPATSTLPSPSSVAVAPVRRTFIAAVGTKELAFDAVAGVTERGVPVELGGDSACAEPAAARKSDRSANNAGPIRTGRERRCGMSDLVSW